MDHQFSESLTMLILLVLALVIAPRVLQARELNRGRRAEAGAKTKGRVRPIAHEENTVDLGPHSGAGAGGWRGENI